jgi:hypothetical protein
VTETEVQTERRSLVYCSAIICVPDLKMFRCRGNVFIELLPSNDKGDAETYKRTSPEFLTSFCVICRGNVFSMQWTSSAKRDTMCRAFASEGLELYTDI